MRGLLVDVGGTLLPDRWPGEGAQQTEARIARMARLGPSLPRDSQAHLVTWLSEVGDTLEGSWEQDTGALIGGVLERLRLPSDADIRERVRAAMCLPAVEWVKPQEGAEFLLRSARRHQMRVGVITNAVWRREADSWRDLQDFGLATYVGAIISSVDAGVRKPNPAIFELALSALGLSADECLIVGNSEVLDVEPAKSMGLRAVRLSTVEGDRSMADAQVPTLTEAWEFILGSPLKLVD